MASKDLLSKRIPTALGLLLLVGGLAAGIFLVGKSQLVSIKAGPTASPRNVKVVNPGPNGFAITWTTDTPVMGFVKYSDNPGKLSLTGGDSRDQRSGNTGSYTTHYVEVVGLSPNKSYYFEVGSGSETYNDNGKPYQTKTMAQTVSPNEDLISGKILLPSGLGAGGVIVYVDMDNAETLAALSKDDGTWRLPLSMAHNKQGQLASYDPEKTQLTIFAQGGNTGTATALTNTKNDSPVPDITLGKTHNFIESDAASVPDNSQTATTGDGFSALASSASASTGLRNSPEATLSVKLLNPEYNGEKIATSNPEIKGEAPAGTTLKITIHSQTEQTGSVIVNNSGNWSYTPPAGLEPGNHTITVEYTDKNGVVQRLIRNFIVLAADRTDGLPAFTATPSASPEVSITPTPTEKVTPTPLVSVSPTASGSNATSTPATTSGLPKAGLLTPTYTLLITGLGLFLGGVIWKKKIDSLINMR